MHIGPKQVYTIGILLSSIATVSMALLYFLHDSYFIVVIILRVLTGFGHGPLFPATYTFLSLWAVPIERGTLTSIAFCSPNLGTGESRFFYIYYY
jgi:MFS family permease